MEKIEFNSDLTAKVFIIYKAVAHPLRTKILKLIKEKNEVNVNLIYNTLKIEQSITSQHLKNLRDAGVVVSRRDGKKIFYSLNPEKFKAIAKANAVMEDTLKSNTSKKKK